MTRDKVKVGVVGCGVVATAYYLPYLAKMDTVDLVAVCDLYKTRTEASARLFGAREQYLDYYEMLDKAELDAVFILTAPGTHVPFTLKAVEMGKHVLIQKPMATNMKDARTIAEAIRKAEYDRAREQLAETVSPLQEVMLKFRDRIYQDVVDIAKSLQKNGTLVGKVGNKAKGLRELYDLLASCTNDTELRDALDTLDSALDTPGADGSAYNAGAIEEALAGVVAVTKDAAEDLRRQTSHKTVAGFLEL